MKKLLIAIAAFTFGSCSKNSNYLITEEAYHMELIQCDTEDNIIKIDNSDWLENSNLNWQDWEYYQLRGFQLNANELVIVTTDNNFILDGKILDIDPSLYETQIHSFGTIVFHWKTPNLINAGDLVKVKLKIAN